MKNLRARRKELGFTCESLGEKVNVQKAAISKYERGDIHPSQDILLKLSKALSCSTDYLLGLTDEPYASKSNGLILNVPPDLQNALLAFNRGEEDLSQEDVDDIATAVQILRERRKRNLTQNLKKEK